MSSNEYLGAAAGEKGRRRIAPGESLGSKRISTELGIS
jgi:hypothetical protein